MSVTNNSAPSYITHQEEMEHANLNARSARLFTGSMMALGFICATAFSAFLASAVKLLSSPESRCAVGLRRPGS